MNYKTWKEVPSEERGDLLELIDPDWTDHFIDPDMGLAFYAEFGSPAVEDALKEFTE